jgi:hypothetical protein
MRALGESAPLFLDADARAVAQLTVLDYARAAFRNLGSGTPRGSRAPATKQLDKPFLNSFRKGVPQR